MPSPPCVWSSELSPTRRHILTLTWAALLLGPMEAFGASNVVWVALAERGGIHEDAAAALRDALRSGSGGQNLDVKIALWRDLQLGQGPAPAMVVTMGSGAYRGMVERASREPALAALPLVATLLPRSSFDAIAPAPNARATAVLLDQPVARYAELLRRAMPDYRRVGVVFGPTTLPLRQPLAEALASRGFQLVDAIVPAGASADAVFPALSSVLQSCDVLLALPDALVVNAASLQNMLIAAYRQRIPMVSYSAAHVRAGATLALHTTPAQSAAQTVTVLRRMLAGRQLPPVQLADTFEVVANEQVARSLGLALPDISALEAAMRRQEGGQ